MKQGITKCESHTGASQIDTLKELHQGLTHTFPDEGVEFDKERLRAKGKTGKGLFDVLNSIPEPKGGLTVAMLRDCLGETGTEIRAGKATLGQEHARVIDGVVMEAMEQGGLKKGEAPQVGRAG